MDGQQKGDTTVVDSAYWIWFQLMFGYGTRRSHALMGYFEDPKQIADDLAAGGKTVSMLQREELARSQKAMERAVELRERTLKKGCEIITPDHERYPKLLQGTFAKPAVLYAKGDLSCLDDGLNIAMVGTRTHSDYGRQVSVYLAGELAKMGVCVVSGLAKGLDTVCHTAALDAGGPSVGVLGCGIDVDYPKGNAALKTRLSQNGAVVSEFPLGTQPNQWTFPIRNRIISGMAHGTVVVEAGERSGSVITAGHALDQGREVFAVPGDIFSVRQLGTHALIRDGAVLVQNPLDILEVFAGRADLPELRLPPREQVPGLMPEQTTFQYPEQPDQPPERREVPEELSGDARQVYERVGPDPASVEEIAADLSLSVAELQTALTELEIYGLIRGYPGRRFSL